MEEFIEYDNSVSAEQACTEAAQALIMLRGGDKESFLVNIGKALSHAPYDCYCISSDDTAYVYQKALGCVDEVLAFYSPAAALDLMLADVDSDRPNERIAQRLKEERLFYLANEPHVGALLESIYAPLAVKGNDDAIWSLAKIYNCLERLDEASDMYDLLLSDPKCSVYILLDATIFFCKFNSPKACLIADRVADSEADPAHRIEALKIIAKADSSREAECRIRIDSIMEDSRNLTLKEAFNLTEDEDHMLEEAGYRVVSDMDCLTDTQMSVFEEVFPLIDDDNVYDIVLGTILGLPERFENLYRIRLEYIDKNYGKGLDATVVKAADAAADMDGVIDACRLAEAMSVSAEQAQTLLTHLKALHVIGIRGEFIASEFDLEIIHDVIEDYCTELMAAEETVDIISLEVNPQSIQNRLLGVAVQGIGYSSIEDLAKTIDVPIANLNDYIDSGEFEQIDLLKDYLSGIVADA